MGKQHQLLFTSSTDGLDFLGFGQSTRQLSVPMSAKNNGFFKLLTQRNVETLRCRANGAKYYAISEFTRSNPMRTFAAQEKCKYLLNRTNRKFKRKFEGHLYVK